MMVHTEIDHLPTLRKAVITIGTFDGVHKGHQKIIAQLKAEAERNGGETVIITFHPHPRKIVYNETKKVELINTIEERISLLGSMGIDHLVIVPFTTGFSELSPREYVEKFLIGRFQPAVVIIGYDHKFGKDRQGDYKLLEEYAGEKKFELKEIPGQLINDSTVSSTLIRHSIQQGNIENANQLLGYSFFFEGEVVKGDQRGRTIGFPTANLKPITDEKIIPGNGVYIVESQLTAQPNRKIKGMMNIGVRPTVNGSGRSIEVNLFDFNEDIYGQRLRVTVKKFLRPETKFSGLQALTDQLKKDKSDSIHYFENELLH